MSKSHTIKTNNGPVTIHWTKTRRFFFGKKDSFFNLNKFSTLAMILISMAIVAIFSFSLKYLENSLNNISWLVIHEVYASAANNNLRAEYEGASDIIFPITVTPAELIKTQLTFKNIGAATWESPSAKELGLVLTSDTAGAFNADWVSKNVVAKISNVVKTGDSISIPVSFYTPVAEGAITYSFKLKRNNMEIVGGTAELKILINKDPAQRKVASALPVPVSTEPVAATNALFPTSQNPFTITNASTAWVGAEPNIRIGLTYASPHIITADTAFNAKDENGALIYSYGAGSLVAVNIARENDQIIYHLKTAGNDLISTSPVRFEAEGGIIQIPSHTRARTGDTIYHVFRGVIEIRFVPASGNLWAINELPLEQYLAGIRETSNPNPREYLKTMTIAARSYGLYHLLRNQKYAVGKFHLTSTDADQVYKGYLSELEMPNLAVAVATTRGQVATYDGKVAVTPYFARGNGQTRTSSALPYVQAVATPATAGYSRWGHGYGLDATDAMSRAKAGVPYYDIIKYYFTGINLERVY